MAKISVIVPVYNEEHSILEVLNGIKKILKTTDYEIIVVDDCSTDKTPQLLKKSGVKVLNHHINKGYGAALKTGILNSTGEWILIIDSDGSYSPEEVPKILRHIPEYDMVVGARIGEKVKTEVLRRIAKWFLTKIANYLTGAKILDLNSGLRIFKKELALKFFDLLPSKFSFTATITLAFLSEEYNVKYVPINYHKRSGKSKIKPQAFFNFILLMIRTITYFNPLKIFLPTSAGLFLFSIGLYLYAFIAHNVFGMNIELKYIITVLVLFSVQIGFFGLLADIISKKR